MAELAVTERVQNRIGNRFEEFGRFFLPDTQTSGFIRTRLYRIEHAEADLMSAAGSTTNTIYENSNDAVGTPVNGTFFIEGMSDPGASGAFFSYHVIGR